MSNITSDIFKFKINKERFLVAPEEITDNRNPLIICDLRIGNWYIYSTFDDIVYLECEDIFKLRKKLLDNPDVSDEEYEDFSSALNVLAENFFDAYEYDSSVLLVGTIGEDFDDSISGEDVTRFVNKTRLESIKERPSFINLRLRQDKDNDVLINLSSNKMYVVCYGHAMFDEITSVIITSDYELIENIMENSTEIEDFD